MHYSILTKPFDCFIHKLMLNSEIAFYLRVSGLVTSYQMTLSKKTLGSHSEVVTNMNTSRSLLTGSSNRIIIVFVGNRTEIYHYQVSGDLGKTIRTFGPEKAIAWLKVHLEEKGYVAKKDSN